MLRSLATVEQYKIFNRVDETGTNESDEEIQLYLDAASAEIRMYSSQDFILCEYTEYYERNSLSGMLKLTYPIKKILSVNNNNYDIKVSDLTIYGNYVKSNYLSYGGNSVCNYVGGFEETPKDVVQATLYLATLRSRQRDRVGLVYSANGASMTTFDRDDIPAFVKRICKNYMDWFGSGIILDRKEYTGVL